LNVDALKAVQTSDPTTPSTCLLRAANIRLARKVHGTLREGTQRRENQ